MSGYYNPGHSIPPHFYTLDPSSLPTQNLHDNNAPPPPPPPRMLPDGSYVSTLTDNPFHQALSGPFVQYPEPQPHPTFVDQYDDGSPTIGAPQGANTRVRRRPAPGEQVKHRRTRSGCYTCRQRRVKCDEAHPTCERCRKGGRECLYPDPQPTQRPVRGSSKSGKLSSGEGASSPEDNADDTNDRLPAILDDGEDDDDMDAGFMSQSQDMRDSSNTPASTLDQSTSPTSTEASSTVPGAMHQSLSRRSSTQATKAALPTKLVPATNKDVQFYLAYFRDHITYHHYSLKYDYHNFFKGDFLAQAIKFEPLKYAVAGYAAYFHTISQPDGRMSTFLQFYNESVSRLRTYLTKSKKQGLATLLTILQLASFEELLGDWVNLMGHQKAAYDMLTRLYSPKTITQSDFLLKVSLWYTRFDLFVGLQSGGEAVLSHDWYEAVHGCYAQKVREQPENLTVKFEERFAYSRLVAKDSSHLFARKGKGLLTDEEFMEQIPIVKEQVEALARTVPPELLDPDYKISDIPGTPQPDDFVNAYEPNIIWGGKLWTTNFLLLDLWAINFMWDISASMAFRKAFEPELIELAYKATQMYEAIILYPNAPPGAIIEAQVSFAVATLFLPKDAKTVQRCCRSFAKIESHGYIFPDVMRNRMLESWGMAPSDWWLPNDESCPPIIRSIKDFIRERSTAPKDQISEDLREMRGIFSSLTISDSPGSDNMTVTSMDSASGPMSARSNFEHSVSGSPDW